MSSPSWPHFILLLIHLCDMCLCFLTGMYEALLSTPYCRHPGGGGGKPNTLIPAPLHTYLPPLNAVLASG